nr:hypothetical protein [Tanacetum cinerariifolium]
MKMEILLEPTANKLLIVGTHGDEVGSSRPKRTCQNETVEEAMLPHIYHEFLLWGTSNRAAKIRDNTNLARLLLKQIYSPYVLNLDNELRNKKVLKFRLGGSGHTLTLLEFAGRFRLYHAGEINDEGFKDLHDRMGNMEIRQGTLERMTRRQLYHTDRYVKLFEHMTGHYDIHCREPMYHLDMMRSSKMMRSSVEMIRLDFVTICGLQVLKTNF